MKPSHLRPWPPAAGEARLLCPEGPDALAAVETCSPLAFPDSLPRATHRPRPASASAGRHACHASGDSEGRACWRRRAVAPSGSAVVPWQLQRQNAPSRRGLRLHAALPGIRWQNHSKNQVVLLLYPPPLLLPSSGRGVPSPRLARGSTSCHGRRRGRRSCKLGA